MIDNTKTYIVELKWSHVQLLSQLLHMVILDDPEDLIAAQVLDCLMTQAEGVQRDPRQHRVFPSPVGAPASAVKFPGYYYIPYGKSQ